MISFPVGYKSGFEVISSGAGIKTGSSFRYNDFAYRVALAFLDGADTVKKIAEVTNTELAAETYVGHIHEVLGDVIEEDE